jgi:hypothetical protein
MKFDNLPVDNYFRFLERNGIMYQRLSARKIRAVNQHRTITYEPGVIIVYRRNEEVQDLGADLEIARATPIDTSPTFKDVPINHWFAFKNKETAYLKVSKYKIQRFSDIGKGYPFGCRTSNHEAVEIFSNCMLDVPIQYRN